eukprot:scaffold139179_cov118-Phaeocystis_antarctica.AAC.1
MESTCNYVVSNQVIKCPSDRVTTRVAAQRTHVALEGHLLAAAQVTLPVLEARLLHVISRHLGREHLRDPQVHLPVLGHAHRDLVLQPQGVPELRRRAPDAAGPGEGGGGDEEGRD